MKYKLNIGRISFSIITTLLLIPLMINCTTDNKGKADNPNIVLIFMDDMGYGDIASNGAINYTTPNIDKLASQGMEFTNFYTASPICSASRAALLTGSYPNRVGITGALFPDSQIGLNSNETTIAEMLKEQGYATGIVGKWHLGDAKKFLPLQHGFDEYFGLPYSNDMWPIDYDGTSKDSPPLPLIEGNETIEYIENMQDQDSLTTRYTQRAVNFINRNGNKEDPFFLYFAHTMPHVPLGVTEKFKGKSKQGIYGDVMMEIDWSVGEIMQALRENGIEENTLVIFTSDNGPWLNFGTHGGSAGGLREGKQTTWSGGVKVPTVMSWPNVIPKGTINNKMAATIDLLPTFAAITGASLPELKIDGVNIYSLLHGDENVNPRNHIYFYYNENDLEAVRKGHWKLILPHKWLSYENELPSKKGLRADRHVASTDLALYNLRRDPGERYNVIEQNKNVVEDIMELVKKAREDLGDNLTNNEGENRREPGRL